MHPAMDQRDWERRARSKHRAGPRARGPWRHPHALWLAVIVAVVVLLQGATYARIHARSSRIQSADEEIARRAEAIRAMLVKQEDLREQVAQLEKELEQQSAISRQQSKQVACMHMRPHDMHTHTLVACTQVDEKE